MICTLCGSEFDATAVACHAKCAMGSGCNLVCCPNCGFQTVDETKSRLAGLLRRLWPSDRGTAGHSWRRGPNTPNRALEVPLTHIPVRTEVEVQRLTNMPASRQTRLSTFGVVPGSQVEVLQRHPSPTIRVGETELALSAEILDQIWVRPQY